VIFPSHCKYVGYATGTPCGDRIYFLTRYLIRETGEGIEVLEVETDLDETGMLRRVTGTRLLASGEDVCRYPEKVSLHDRTFLVEEAIRSGRRCTIFTGLDEHTTFVIDPDLSGYLRLHVYDIMPPRPHLSATIRDLEKTGLFGELEIVFEHHLRDIREIGADVYPCRAAGFDRTLDSDPLRPGDLVAGCRTGAQIVSECYGEGFAVENICPLAAVKHEPFIARCCRSEREGIGRWNGLFGAVVHWGAPTARIARAVEEVAAAWREAYGQSSSR
jgi:hypothetical protein